jgi:type I restriction enzyme S subunit
MSDIANQPDGWELVRLADHTTVKARLGWKGLKAEEYIEDGFIFLATPNLKANQIDFENVNYITKWRYDESPEIQLQVGDVLIVKDGSTLGISNYVRRLPRLTTVNGSIAVVRTRSSLHSEFLYHLVNGNAFQKLIELKKAGLGVPHLFQADLREFFVSLPPLPQQRKIARILTTVDNLIEKTEAMIAKYQAIKQGMMHDLFTRGVDEHGRLRPPYEQAPELYKQSELGWIPKEWEVRRVDEVGTVKLGRQRSPKHQSGRFTTPYLRVANVFDGFIDYSDVLEMDFTPREKETYSLLPGDILLNEGQSLELVGRSAIYEGEPHLFCFQNTLIRFRAYLPNDARFCRGIFKYYIDIGKFMTIARQTTSVAHLGADRLAQLAFPCPHSDEQHRIAKALFQHEKRCELDRAYLNNLLQSKNGVMQDLLTGKVRVNVDEADEVAHV